MTDNVIARSHEQRGFTRRSFIKGAAALTAAGALTSGSANTGGLTPATAEATKAGQEKI